MSFSCNTPSDGEMNVIIKMVAYLSKSRHFKNLSESDMVAICLMARELDIPYMMALNGGIYPTPTGKLGTSAQLMQALVQRGGIVINIKESSHTNCILEFKREGFDPFLHQFSIEDARQANLIGKDNWKKYTKDMLFCRCLASGARKIAPDKLSNMYLAEELEDIVEYKSPERKLVEQPIETEILLSKNEIEEIKLLGSENSLNRTLERLTKAFGYKSYKEVPVNLLPDVKTAILQEEKNASKK